MIGSDPFVSVFGGAPAHTAEHLTEHLRAVIRAGFSPVLCKPGTKEAACILSTAQAKRAGRHPCGYLHVLDDPTKIGTVVKRFTDTWGGLNVGLHLGRSHLAVLKMPAAPGATVLAPGDIGHWWFVLPDQPWGKSRSGQGWTVLRGGGYVLVPPSVDAQGTYRLIGGAHAAPSWLVNG